MSTADDRAGAPKHPIISGAIVGTVEISIMYPWEFVKRQMQLQQCASLLTQQAGESALFRDSLHCASETVRVHGIRGLYCGFDGWVVLAGPRAGCRFAAFEGSMSVARGWGVSSEGQLGLADTVCGFIAGIVEAAAVQTPNQAVSVRMLHDQSPAGPQRYRGLNSLQTARLIYREHGLVNGFFCGLEPAVVKGAAVNCIRFPIFGFIKRALQRDDPAPRPLPPHQAMLAGGLAGGVSAVLTQPIDTVMGNMLGLEAARYRSSLDCARALVRAGGIRALYHGLGTRVVRVVVEIGLTFALYEQISPIVDRWLATRWRG